MRLLKNSEVLRNKLLEEDLVTDDAQKKEECRNELLAIETTTADK